MEKIHGKTADYIFRMISGLAPECKVVLQDIKAAANDQANKDCNTWYEIATPDRVRVFGIIDGGKDKEDGQPKQEI